MKSKPVKGALAALLFWATSAFALPYSNLVVFGDSLADSGNKALLADALQTYLKDSIQAFGAFLITEAQAAPRDALAEVNILLEQADDNIRAAATALVAGQKHLADCPPLGLPEYADRLAALQRLMVDMPAIGQG